MKMSSITLPSNGVKKSISHNNVYFSSFVNEIAENEKLTLQRIDEAWQARDVEKMFQLIEENIFPSEKIQKKVLDYWDKAHYYQAAKKSRKPLTALARFRIRERNIPPKSIAPSGRQKTTLPKEATSILREWLDVNSHRPYPTKEEKESLAKMTKLTVLQVNTWYANTRRRMRAKRTKNQVPKEDDAKNKRFWTRTSPQPWNKQVPLVPSTASTSAFTPFSGANIAAPSLAVTGSNSSNHWPGMCDRTFMPDWLPSSHSTAIGSQFFSAPVVALTPILWNPEFQYCGLHTAAQILMDMASK